MRKNNWNKKYARIQRQFSELMAECTPGGAKPSSSSVVEALAERWCLSEERVREILNMKLK